MINKINILKRFLVFLWLHLEKNKYLKAIKEKTHRERNNSNNIKAFNLKYFQKSLLLYFLSYI